MTITEFAVRPELAKRLNSILNPFLHTRNLETFRRLEDLTLERVGTPN